MKFTLRKLSFLILTVFCVIIYGNLCAAIPLDKTDFSLTVHAGKLTYVFTYPEIDIYGDRLYLKNIEEAVDRIYCDTKKAPVNARIKFYPRSEEKFFITKENSGEELDKSRLFRTISDALKNRTNEICVELNSIRPTVTYGFLSEHTFNRAQFKTFYGNSAEGRKHNVRLCAEILNGTVIECGESFSFNDTVGERTYERGFTDAKVIYEGKFIEGVGGGVCQVSSTLYNCALLAGMEIEERHPHSLTVGYVEPSFDAMVSYGCCDLKFKNVTDGPVFIECTADGNDISFSLYGAKMNYIIKRVSRTVKSECPGMDVIIDTTGELCGELEEKTVLPPKNSLVSEGYLEYYNGETLVKTLRLGRSCYGGVKGVLAKKAPKTQENDEIKH